jgi:nitric oxide reductase NorD protein
MDIDQPLQPLATFDPELAQTLADAARRSGVNLPAAVLTDVVDTIFLGYRLEMNLGAAVADGYRRLLASGHRHALEEFGRQIRQAADRSVGLARNLAVLLPPVLLAHEDGLSASFHRTLAVLLAKGEYLVKAPLEGLAPLVLAADGSAGAYLELLQTVFDRTLSYNRCQYLGNLLPRAVTQLASAGRKRLVEQMTRLARVDLDLIEPYLEGVSAGLALLSPKALQTFVDRALVKMHEDPRAGRRFLALHSGQGRDACRHLQTAVTLNDSLPRLNRYLHTRTGQSGRIRPISTIRKNFDLQCPGRLQSGTDGVYLYLPDVVDDLASREDNERLLANMAKFEAGLIEFATFTFDLKRAEDLGCLETPTSRKDAIPEAGGSDFTAFSRWFEDPRLALDLLTIFEHARIRLCLTGAYPGLIRSGLPLFQAAMRHQLASRSRCNFLDACYAVLALDLPTAATIPECPDMEGLLQDIAAAFYACNPPSMRVEHAAGLVQTVYSRVRTHLLRQGSPPTLLSPVYRMALQPEIIDAAGRDADRQAERLVKRLRGCGLEIYRGDLRQMLQNGAGPPKVEDILKLACGSASDIPDMDPATVALQKRQVPVDLLTAEGLLEDDTNSADIDRITWLKEWNATIGDYLLDHVRVRDRRLGGSDTAFYTRVLERCEGLVRRIRRSFELLRPEGLGILRQWVEGDDFDYRALLDFVVDRKAGRQPSDRLYIKRVKQRRDVAVMLLVDLSRSTANLVSGASRSVLDVAKEAIVLFTQALEVVGDCYAVAGFSGTGRLGVDFFRIKDFDEPLDSHVKGTISALTPQRSTRMGAAVRRAALDLVARENRVRLLLLIGDGFPNDTEYKDDYAVEDTRQAIAEACSSGIITQAITVNLPTSPQLDQLYGPVRHTVISDVTELPDKLLRLYGTLTRA